MLKRYAEQVPAPFAKSSAEAPEGGSELRPTLDFLFGSGQVDTFWSTLADAMVAMVAWNYQNFAEDSNVPRQQQALLLTHSFSMPATVLKMVGRQRLMPGDPTMA